jgi:hypothetical protein
VIAKIREGQKGMLAQSLVAGAMLIAVRYNYGAHDY